MIRQHFNATGGGPPTDLVMTELEKRIETICGRFQIRGDESIDDMGFGRPLLAPHLSTDFPIDEHIPSTSSNSNNSLVSIGNDSSCDFIHSSSHNVSKRLFFDENETIDSTTPKFRNISNESFKPQAKRYISNQSKKVCDLHEENNDILKILVDQNVSILASLDKTINLIERLLEKRRQ